jgi:hypothetical protein
MDEDWKKEHEEEDEKRIFEHGEHGRIGIGGLDRR